MTWGIQNSFSIRTGDLFSPFGSASSSGESLRQSWLRLGIRPEKSESGIQEKTLVEHFRSPKMARVEAALFVSDTSVSPRKLVQLATLADHKESVELIEQLNESYQEMGSAIRIERVATGYRMLTIPKVVPWLDKLHHRQSDLKLSASAMETLTIIAYRQPVTRADIEIVRGVQASEVLKHLLEKGLIRVAGEEDTLGRPYLYDTTRKFLELFGLRTLQDLPKASELREPASKTFKSKNSPEEEKTESVTDSDVIDIESDSSDEISASEVSEEAEEVDEEEFESEEDQAA